LKQRDWFWVQVNIANQSLAFESEIIGNANVWERTENEDEDDDDEDD
jgi:hypothetical protein